MPFETPDALSEAAVASALHLLASALHRKISLDMTVIYHRTLDRAGVTDYQLERATQEILKSEERFPTIATILRYARGEGKSTGGEENAVIRGTNIRCSDYVADPDRYAEFLCKIQNEDREAARREREQRQAVPHQR
jgi:hypothetical protein